MRWKYFIKTPDGKESTLEVTGPIQSEQEAAEHFERIRVAARMPQHTFVRAERVEEASAAAEIV